MKYLFYLLISVGFISAGVLSISLFKEVMERKNMKEDYAEINRVNYELFNIQLWKEEALHIFQQRIREFEISDEAYTALKGQVEVYLKQLYAQYIESGELFDFILDNLEQGGKINKMFLNIIKTTLDEQLDELDLQSYIPGLSNQLTEEIRKNEPLLKSYLQQELLRLVIEDASRAYFDRRRLVYARHGQPDLDTTDAYLSSEIEIMNHSINKNFRILIAIIVLLLILPLTFQRWVGFKTVISTLTVLSILLLVHGITMPMIDIDARLNSFAFELMGEPIEFEEQVIYFQSKSIVEVTQTLWRAGGIDLKAVGVLVFLFSIVFPFFKLILSALYLFVQKIQSSLVAQNIIFHLGKWSMADVFVVAMFMAYIGLYGLIASQLDTISQNQGGFAIETVNYSKLSPGAFFFTAYTLLSIFIGILINKKTYSVS